MQGAYMEITYLNLFNDGELVDVAKFMKGE